MGGAHFFLAAGGGVKSPGGLAWSEPPTVRPWQRGESWALVLVAACVLVIARTLGRVRAGPVRVVVAATVLACFLTALGIAPAALLALLAFAGLGLASAP